MHMSGFESFHHNCQLEIWKSFVSYLINACVTQNWDKSVRSHQMVSEIRCHLMQLVVEKKRSRLPFHHFVKMAWDASDDTDWAHRNSWESPDCANNTIEVNSEHIRKIIFHIVGRMLKTIRVTNTRTKGKPRKRRLCKADWGECGARLFAAIFQQQYV